MRYLLRLLRSGWRMVTEAHTIYWIAGLLGISAPPAGALTAVLAFVGEHSAALLTIAFAILLAVFTAIVLLVLGYRRESQLSAALAADAGTIRSTVASSLSITPAEPRVPPSPPGRYMTASEAIRYIANDSGWGRRIRSPNPGESRQVPLFAATEEFARAARAGEIVVLGRLNRLGNHQAISQPYWLDATVEQGSILASNMAGTTSSISTDRESRERFTYYDGLCVTRTDVLRAWPTHDMRESSI
jgi:hypothetical protein